MIQILLSGAGGKMGQVISRSVSERVDCRIAAGIDRQSAAVDYPIFEKPSDCDVCCDVIIDFSNPAGLEKLLDYGPHDCVILLGAERYSRMTCVLAEMAHNAGCRLIVITDKLTAPFAGDADIVLLADLSSPTPTNSYIGVNFLIEVIAFEFSRTLGVYPQQRLSRLDAYLSELQLY